MQTLLNYFEPKNESVITKTGFRYLDTTSVMKYQKAIVGQNDIDLFEQFYKLNNSLRYCNGSYYLFDDSEYKNKYDQWLKSDDYKSKSFSLYYGKNGIVD